MAGVGKAVLLYLVCPCLAQPAQGPVQLHIHLEGGQAGQQGQSEGEGEEDQGAPVDLYIHMEGGQEGVRGQDGEGEDYQAQHQSKREVRENLEKKVKV